MGGGGVGLNFARYWRRRRVVARLMAHLQTRGVAGDFFLDQHVLVFAEKSSPSNIDHSISVGNSKYAKFPALFPIEFDAGAVTGMVTDATATRMTKSAASTATHSSARFVKCTGRELQPVIPNPQSLARCCFSSTRLH
jgi:hypothetical protein